MNRHVGVLEPDAHARQVLFRQPDHTLVDVTQYRRLDRRVLDHFPQHAAVPAADDEHFAWVWVGVEGQVRDHLLVTGNRETEMKDGVSMSLVGGSDSVFFLFFPFLV